MTEVTESRIRRVLWLFIVVLAGLEARALSLHSHYKYDILMCLILLLGFYALRRVLRLHWLHYNLFGVFLLVHSLGMFGFYDLYPLGIEYDYWVHGYFGLVSSLILLHAMRALEPAPNFLFAAGITLTVVLGLSAAHELYEFAGAILLGEGEGVLFIGAGDLDPWDTQKDMLNNLIGGAAGLAGYLVYLALRRRHRS